MKFFLFDILIFWIDYNMWFKHQTDIKGINWKVSIPPIPIHPISLTPNFYSSSGSLGFPCGLAGKESACNVGDLGSTPGLGRSPGKGKGYPLQYSSLGKSMECRVHGVTKSGSLCQSMQIKYKCSYSPAFFTQEFVHHLKHFDFLSHLTIYPEISSY